MIQIGKYGLWLSLILFILYFALGINFTDENGEPVVNRVLLYVSGLCYSVAIFMIDIKLIVTSQNNLFGGVERKDDPEKPFGEDDYTVLAVAKLYMDLVAIIAVMCKIMTGGEHWTQIPIIHMIKLTQLITI